MSTVLKKKCYIVIGGIWFESLSRSTKEPKDMDEVEVFYPTPSDYRPEIFGPENVEEGGDGSLIFSLDELKLRHLRQLEAA